MNVTHIKIGVELDFLKNVSENSPYGFNLNLYVMLLYCFPIYPWEFNKRPPRANFVV